MERLAEKLKDILNEQDFCFEPWEIKVVEKALNRFAAYENTGLEPKEIQAIAGIASENCAKTADAIDKLLQDDAELESYRDLGPIDHLRELVQADQEGRCVVLPCKVGDTVYFITGIHGRIVKPAQVEEIYIGDGSIALGVSTGFRTFTLQASEYYINREAAEEAMKAREQDD